MNKKILFFAICLSLARNTYGYTVTIENQFDVTVRVTTEYQNPELCPLFSFDVPSGQIREQKYTDDCCLTKLTVEAKDRTYYQFGTGACTNFYYIIRPKADTRDFFIDQNNGSTIDMQGSKFRG